MTSKVPVVLAIDPGEKTGIAMAHGEKMLLAAVHSVNTFVSRIGPMVSDLVEYGYEHGVPAVIVVEKFTITTQTGKMSTIGINWPLELTGVTRYVAYIHDMEINTKQMPSTVKHFATDAKLKVVGWFDKCRAAEEGSEDHARDAARHALFYLTSNRHIRVPR